MKITAYIFCMFEAQLKHAALSNYEGGGVEVSLSIYCLVRSRNVCLCFWTQRENIHSVSLFRFKNYSLRNQKNRRGIDEYFRKLCSTVMTFTKFHVKALFGYANVSQIPDIETLLIKYQHTI